ncbi:hypothetical protein E1B28_003103 [Marasmius oreades]|uniref:Uncharacterized protein n=1 Tax=Marasmius oreades TaxID=181124 RepID=A0A9P7ULX6_9AGAR|nr:uncharacterized protein E1B28_003103 [Marasmius oreades]KAG7085546.1 hypothetical protein E1B28_003103 [Marasmius oreades]
MHPDNRDSFEFPVGGFLQIQGVVTEEELRTPNMIDGDGVDCFLVLKSGKSTGLTPGRGTSIESFVREYTDSGNRSTFMAVAIYPYSHKDGAFSEPGDSRSIVVDDHGRIVGLLTGGATGLNGSTDVTYLTPYYWIEERIKEAFPDSCLY